jgi:cell division protein FtsA
MILKGLDDRIMLQPSVLLGLDLGASKVVAVVAVQGEDGTLQVTGASHESSGGGIEQGEITDINLTKAVISKTVEDAMHTAGQTKLDGIRVSVDGIQFKGENLRDSVTISSPDRVITRRDRDRVLEKATEACKLAKEETVLHKIPQLYHTKGQKNIKNPVDMVADTLEAEVRIIVAPASVLDNINRALHLSCLTGAVLHYSPLASAKAVLKREDSENGAVIVDIGEQLTHIGVFMRGALFHSAVIPVGGMYFTRDLEMVKHLGGISIAERLKKLYGTVLPDQTSQDEWIELEDEGRRVLRRELAEVLNARAVELLNMVLAEIGRSGINMDEIHGGVHLVGGGALLPHLPILAQSILGRPRVVLGKVYGLKGLQHVIANPLYTNALGVVKVLSEEMNELEYNPRRTSGLMGWLKEMF